MFSFSKDNNKSIILPSGKALNITLGQMAEVMPLYRSVVSEFKKNGISFDLSGLKDVEVKDGKVKLANLFPFISQNLNGVINGFLDIVISKEVVDCVFVCARRCLLDNQRITPELFDNIEYREDFFLVMYHIICENLRPFFPRLPMVLKQIKETVKEPK